MRAGNSADANVAIHPLNCPKLLPRRGQVIRRSGRDPQLPLAGRREHGVRPVERLAAVQGHVGAVVDVVESGAREVLCDFDLDVAQVELARDAVAALLGWVVGLFGARRAALEAAVPVVGDEGLLLVVLGRAVGVDVVYVWKVGFESFDMVRKRCTLCLFDSAAAAAGRGVKRTAHE